MTLFRKKKIYLTALTALLIGASIGFAYGIFSDGGDLSVKNVSKQFDVIAKEIVSTCENENYKPSCYDEEIPKLMDEGYTMEEAFQVTRVVQQMDRSYQYCHVLGHYLSAKETAKDSSKWKDVVARAPLGVCSNGAIHGAFQERFRVESMAGKSVAEIEPELMGVCEPRPGWSPTLMGQATCIHALGHLTMYATGAHIEDSLDLCDRLVEGDQPNDSKRQLCYDGAFMQIYQPLEPEDIALIAGKEIETIEESIEFCESFSGSRLGSCISESWPLYNDSIKDPKTISLICERSKFDEWQYQRCTDGIFYVAMAQSNLSVDWAKGFCPKVGEELQGRCFGNSASRLIEVDNRNVSLALELCDFAYNEHGDETCFDELLKYSGYTFAVGSPEFYELCNGMPDSWSFECLLQTKRENL